MKKTIIRQWTNPVFLGTSLCMMLSASITGSVLVNAQSVNPVEGQMSNGINQTTGNNIQSEELHCGQDAYEQYMRATDPGFDQRMKQLRQYMNDHREDTPSQKTQAILTFPVVFHVLYNSPSGNVSDACIQSQIDALNRDFRKKNTDITTAPSQFQAIAADFQMEFCLASKGPNGNPTNGIERKATTSSGYTAGSGDPSTASKGGLDSWGDKYLNIWVLPIAGGVGGWGTYPLSPYDGVYLRPDLFGQASGGCTNMSGWDKGRAAVHEVGHWFSLIHTFNAGCVGTSASTCKSQGDNVCDTPPTAKQNSACTPGQNTCTETPADQIDMLQNYMDYTKDACKVLFTQGQLAYINPILWMRESVSNNAATACAGVGVNELNIDNYISVSPNPSVDGNISINLNAFDLGQVRIKIYNVLGEVIAEIPENVSAPKKIKINMEDQPNGIYLVELKTTNAKATKKIMLNK